MPTMRLRIADLDHFVLTVRDLDATVNFYERVLGMRAFTFADGTRKGLAFGRHKINLHQVGHEHLPNAREARPGSADLCFLTDTPLEDVIAHLAEMSVAVEYGPDAADGARGRLRSVWLRDPDGNLIELANRAAE